MENFTFHNPVKIVFGKNALDSLGGEIRNAGDTVLFVYGKDSIKKSGLYDTVVKILKQENKKVIEHAGVQPNPVLSHTLEGIAKAKEGKVDFVLAVGGGSATDEAKAIAVGAVHDGDFWQFFTGERTAEKALPLYCVLTIPATGTEMNNGMVVTNEKTNEKLGLFTPNSYPKVSFLDPMLTITIPKNYTAYSGVDAMSHSIEGYLSTTSPWTPVLDRYVEGLVMSIMESIDVLMENPRDYNARASFMWAASLAWNGLTTAGFANTGVPAHMLGHPLSALYDLAHGATLSITTLAWMKWALERGNRKIPLFARHVLKVEDKDDAQAGVRGIEKLTAWFKKIGVPVSLTDAGVPEGDMDKLVQTAGRLAEVWGMTGDYPNEVIRKLYELAL